MINRKDIAAYNEKRADLELNYSGKWTVFHDGELVGLFDQFEVAADEAVRRFGAGPFLIRQVGAPPVVLPASMMFRVGRA
jgi:hypothetical protein